MAAKDMDTRQKMGPLAGQWKTINDRNPLLKNRGIDTSGVVAHIKQYDAALAQYKTLDDKWWALDKALPPLVTTNRDLGGKLMDLDNTLDELMKKDQAVFSPAVADITKMAADPKADPVAVVATLDKMVEASDDVVVGRGGLWNQMDKIAKQKLQAITKVRDDYRSQINSIDKSIGDLEKRCDTLESEMRALITKYQAQARKLDHKKVADDMEAFKTVLDGP